MEVLIWILFVLPLLGAGALFLIPRAQTRLHSVCSIVFSIAALAVSVIIIFLSGTKGGFFITRSVLSVGVLGVDTISAYLTAHTALLAAIVLLMSSRNPSIQGPGFYRTFMLLLWAVNGFFLSMNLVLSVLFWALSLVSAWALCSLYAYAGSTARVSRSLGVWAFLSIVGFLTAVIMIGRISGSVSGGVNLDYVETLRLMLPLEMQNRIMAFLLVAFVLFVPVWPFHSWIFRTLEESTPTAAAMFLGVITSMAVYGILRFAVPLAPLAMHNAIPTLCVAGIVSGFVGVIGIWRENDLRRTAGYVVLVHAALMFTGIGATQDLSAAGVWVFAAGQGLIDAVLVLVIFITGDRKRIFLVETVRGTIAFDRRLGIIFSCALALAAGIPGTVLFAGILMTAAGASTASHTLSSPLAVAVCLLAVWTLSALGLGRVLSRTVFVKTTGGQTEKEDEEKSALSPLQAIAVCSVAVLAFIFGFKPGIVGDSVMESCNLNAHGARELAFRTVGIQQAGLFETNLSALVRNGEESESIVEEKKPEKKTEVTAPVKKPVIQQMPPPVAGAPQQGGPPRLLPDGGVQTGMPTVYFSPEETKGVKWSEYVGPDGNKRKILDPQWVQDMMRKKGLLDENGNLVIPENMKKQIPPQAQQQAPRQMPPVKEPLKPGQ